MADYLPSRDASPFYHAKGHAMRLLLLCALACLLTVDSLPELCFADEGKFEGALWRYTVSFVGMKDDVREGVFRIDGRKMYQPRGGKPTEIGIINAPKFVPKKGDKIPVTFEKLRSKDGNMLALKGEIEFIELGEVKGRLVDGEGRHWNFRATRFQE